MVHDLFVVVDYHVIDSNAIVCGWRGPQHNVRFEQAENIPMNPGPRFFRDDRLGPIIGQSRIVDGHEQRVTRLRVNFHRIDGEMLALLFKAQFQMESAVLNITLDSESTFSQRSFIGEWSDDPKNK
jgi:hypothetical protein